MYQYCQYLRHWPSSNLKYTSQKPIAIMLVTKKFQVFCFLGLEIDQHHTTVCHNTLFYCRYNNEWMIVDYNKFKPGIEKLPDGLLTVLEQIP